MKVYCILCGVFSLWRLGVLSFSPRSLYRLWLAWRKTGSSLAFLSFHAADRFGSALALCDDNGGMTYADLQQACETMACHFVEAFCLGSGKRAALIEHNRRTFIVALLACARTGADVLLLNPKSPAKVIRQILAEQSVHLILHGQDIDIGASAIDHTACMPLSDESLEAMCHAPSRLILPRVKHPGSLMLMTSGTTGSPKSLERRPKITDILVATLGLLTQLPLRLEQPVVLAVPLTHGHGLASLAMCFAFGAPIFTGKKYEIAPLIARCHKKRPPLVVTVPTLLYRWMAQTQDTGPVFAIITGSAPLPPTLSQQLQQRLGPILYNLYGSSEAGLIALSTPEMQQQAPGTVGKCLPGTRLRLVNHEGDLAAPGTIGHIHVRGPLVMAHSEDGWLKTGDLGRFDDGCLHLCGRADSMIISGGENVYPGEVKAALCGHPAIHDVAIAVVEDREFGQRMRAFVVLHPHASATPCALMNWLGDHLDRHKLPQQITILPALPPNAADKMDRP